MRTLSTQESKALSSNRSATHVRVKVKDSGGTFRDLTSLVGKDWLTGVDIDFDQDQPVAQARVSVKRESYNDSLSPLHVTSRCNLLTGSYSPLINPGREFYIEMALMPDRVPPASGDWKEVFRGDIDEPDFAAPIGQFVGKDLGNRLQILQIEQDANGNDRIYGSAGAGTAVETVIQEIIKDAHGVAFGGAPSSVALRDRITPTTQNGFWYRCTTAGTKGTEPGAWGTTIGGTTAAGGGGSAVWTNMGVCPTLNVIGGVSGQTVTKYKQKSQGVLEAIRVLAQLNGYDIRYLWDSGSSTWKLSIYNPPRASTTSLYTWDADHYKKVLGFKIDRTDVRNKIKVWYPDSSALVTGTSLYQRKSVTVEDATSQDTYTGGLPSMAEIAEADSSQLDTSGEATALANAVLADLKDPIAECQFELPLDYACELNDIYTFNGNGVHHTANTKLAVTRIHHSFAVGQEPSTTVDVRGTPIGAVTDWLAKQVTGLMAGSSSASIAAASSGGVSTVGTPVGRSSTLTGSMTFTSPSMMSPSVTYNEAPLNRSFEALSDPDLPPDAWTAKSGTWGTGMQYLYGFGGATNSVLFTAASKAIASSYVPVEPNILVQLEAFVHCETTNSKTKIWVEEYDATFANIQTGTATVVDSSTHGSAGKFAMAFLTTNSGSTGYVRFCIGTDSTYSSGSVWYDSVRGLVANQLWSTATFGTNWGAWGDASYGDIQYMRDAAGFVHMRGLGKNLNAANLTCTTLPAGYRPSKHLICNAVTSGGAAYEVRVYTTGNIDFAAPVLNGWHSLADIRFLAEA